jgi:Tfp pilus assembly PilM family ATPase
MKWNTKEDVAGLDIVAGNITASRIEIVSGGRMELCQAGWTTYDPDMPDKQLADVIRKLWRQSGMPTTTVCASLRSRSLVLHYFRFENIPVDELEPALWLKAEETLQMRRSQIVIDWHLNRNLGKNRNPAEEKIVEGVLIAAPQQDVDQQLKLLTMAGLFPVILDVGSMAVANLFLALKGNDLSPEPVCVTNLSTRTADIAILANRQWIYPQTVISRAADWEQAIPFLCENIMDALKYYEFKQHHTPVTRLILTGATADKLAGALRQRLNLPVETWDPLSSMSIPSSALSQRLTQTTHGGQMLASSLGLALRGD